MQGVNQFLCKDLIYVSLTKANEHGMISQNMLLEMRIAHHIYFVYLVYGMDVCNN